MNRDYDASIGRYVQSDPIGLGGGVNTFGYVGGNPLSYTDESGLIPNSVQMACAQDPAFCADVMGQIQQNNADMARAQGNCAAADALQASANTLRDIGTVATIVTLAHAAKGAVDLVKNVKNAAKWTRTPSSLQDQMALDAAKSGAGAHMKDLGPLRDPAYYGMEKWEYKVRSADGKVTVVHYVRDPITGELMDFKFKKRTNGRSYQGGGRYE